MSLFTIRGWKKVDFLSLWGCVIISYLYPMVRPWLPLSFFIPTLNSSIWFSCLSFFLWHLRAHFFSWIFPPSCLAELCPVPCGSHGVCSEGQCQCEEGWIGAACDQRACHPRCEEHGQCHDGTCICQPGWEGDHCNIGELHLRMRGCLIIPSDFFIFFWFTGFNRRFRKIFLSQSPPGPPVIRFSLFSPPLHSYSRLGRSCER